MPSNTEPKVVDFKTDPEVDWVVNRYHESQNYYRPLYTKFKEWDDQYFSIPGSRPYSWQSNIFVPATFKSIKTLLARIVAAILPGMKPPFDAIGVEEKDKEAEGAVKRLIDYQFEKTNVFNKFVLLVLQSLVRGTSIGKVYWKKDYRFVPRQVEYEEQRTITVDDKGKYLKKKDFKYITETKTKTIYDRKIIYEGPDFEVIDVLGGFYPDPYAVNLNDSYVIHRVIRTEDYLKKNKKNYQNITNALRTDYPGDDEWNHSRLKNIGIPDPEMRQKSSTDQSTSKSDDQLRKYELLECHCKYDINNDGFLEDCIITICNRQVMIKKVLNPYPEGCFVKIGFMPVLGEFYWQGVCELVEPLQKELNDKRNQRLDNVNLVLQPILQYVEGAIDTNLLKNFVYAPGARLPVKDINASAWDRPPDVTASAYTEEQITTHDIQETSGALNVMQPSSQQNDIHRTASGLFMLKGEAETNLKLIVSLVEQMGLADIAKKYNLLNKSLMTQPLTVRILGTKGHEYPLITPEDIQYYNHDFVFKGASAYVNREIRLAQFTKLMDVFSKIPIMMQKVDPDKLVKIIANALGFEEEEFMRDQQMQQQLFQGAEQQSGGVLEQAGLNPEQGPGGALNQMAGQGLSMEQISGQMGQLQEQFG